MDRQRSGQQSPWKSFSFVLCLIPFSEVPVGQSLGGVSNCKFTNPRSIPCGMTGCQTTTPPPRRKASSLSGAAVAANAAAVDDGGESHRSYMFEGSGLRGNLEPNPGRSSRSRSKSSSEHMGSFGRGSTGASSDTPYESGGVGLATKDMGSHAHPLSGLECDGGGGMHGKEDEKPTWRGETATTSEELLLSIKAALAARTSLMRRLREEETDCYRLFHGAVEGCPGLTVDRYGTVLLIQTFRDPPADFGAQAVEEICQVASDAINAVETLSAPAPGRAEAARFFPVWNDRRKRERQPQGRDVEHQDGPPPHKLHSGHEPLPEALGVKVGLENGVRHALAARHRGIDPWLFLDLRVARKWVLGNSQGKEVLNLFSYTGGVAAAAACGGAKSVWNIDFAASAHKVGKASLKLNDALASNCECKWMKRDVLPTIRQLAGTPTRDYRQVRRGRNAEKTTGRSGRNSWKGGRGRGAPQGRVSGGYGGVGRHGEDVQQRWPERKEEEAETNLGAKQFDLVFLDPPTWSKSKHGAVDLVRDYQTLFKPSLFATKEGGTIVATNHVSTVDCAEWMESLSRCAKKAGRRVKSVQVLPPEEDFPSPDGRHPLKIAIVCV